MKEAAQSGMNAGRAAMGTMTTTLLLAYSGGYIALDDIHGTGNTDRQYPELQICSSRITGHDRWKLLVL